MYVELVSIIQATFMYIQMESGHIACLPILIVTFGEKC